jgi:predicted  nucleic acid-binding Zn-ribbon protein
LLNPSTSRPSCPSWLSSPLIFPNAPPPLAVFISVTYPRQEINRINGEENRLRENMKALRGSVEEKALLQRYVQQLNSQEDRLVALNREINNLENLRSTLTEQLDLMVQKIAVDEKIDHGVEARASN